MTILRTKCCPGGGATEPGTDCDGTDFIPPHSSVGSRRQARITSGMFNLDLLTAGATLTHGLGYSPVGRYPLTLDVTSAQPLWTALVIVWFDQPANIDPRIVGAINSWQAGTQLKIARVSGWPIEEILTPIPERSGPWLVAGAVVEQAGQIFVSQRLIQTDLLVPNPCCWMGAGGGGADSLHEPCRATRRAFQSDLSSPTEDVVGGSGVLSQDWFGRVLADGTFDRDQRPDFNLGQSSHPITRFGWCIGLTSCPWEMPSASHGAAGSWSVLGQLGPICGTLLAHGAEPYTGGTSPPEPLGTLEINEPLDTLPAGWFPNGLYFDDDAFHGSEASGPATWSNRDGATFVESLFGGEYNGGTLSTTLPIARSDWQHGARLTIEWTHRRVRDADRRFALPGDPDPGEYRDQTNGIFVGGLFRWMLRHENAGRLDDALGGGGTQPRYGWLATGPVHPFGGQVLEVPQYTSWPFEWDYDTDEEPNLPSPISWQLAGEGTFDARQLSCVLVAPNDGDRVTLTVDLAIVTQPNNYTFDNLTDTINVWRWTVRSWINGRLITPSLAVSDNAGVFFAPPPLTSLRLGLCAYRGGGWQDLKVWLHNPTP